MAVHDQAVGSDVIQYEVEGGVATIWLNRPEVKNCVNWELLIGSGGCWTARRRTTTRASWSSAAAATRSAPAPI